MRTPPRLISWPLTLLLLLASLTPLLIVTAPVSAQEAITPATKSAVTPQKVFQLEIESIFQGEQAQLAELLAEFAAATDDEAALTVQREIAALKQATEIEVLEAQVRFARQLGRYELAKSIAADIAELRDPQRAEKRALKDEIPR